MLHQSVWRMSLQLARDSVYQLIVQKGSVTYLITISSLVQCRTVVCLYSTYPANQLSVQSWCRRTPGGSA